MAPYLGEINIRRTLIIFLSLAIGVGVIAWFTGYSFGTPSWRKWSSLHQFLCVTQVLMGVSAFLGMIEGPKKD